MFWLIRFDPNGVNTSKMFNREWHRLPQMEKSDEGSPICDEDALLMFSTQNLKESQMKTDLDALI